MTDQDKMSEELEAAMKWAEGLDSTMMTEQRLAFVKALAAHARSLLAERVSAEAYSVKLKARVDALQKANAWARMR